MNYFWNMNYFFFDNLYHFIHLSLLLFLHCTYCLWLLKWDGFSNYISSQGDFIDITLTGRISFPFWLFEKLIHQNVFNIYTLHCIDIIMGTCLMETIGCICFGPLMKITGSGVQTLCQLQPDDGVYTIFK